MYNKFKKVCLIAFFSSISLVTYAQDGIGGDGGDQEQPDVAPINSVLPYVLLAGIGLGYVLLRKKTAENK